MLPYLRYAGQWFHVLAAKEVKGIPPAKPHELLSVRHAPNLDSVKWLAEELWPLMREQLPQGTELHNYGAYGTAASVKCLHKPV